MAALVLTDEEQMARDVARRFCLERTPVAQLRKLRDQRAGPGFDPAVWRDMVGLGWPGVPWPEADGGFDAGYRMLGVITEETGRTLTASPLIGTAWIGGTAIGKAGSQAQRGMLAKIAAGEVLIALAHDEGHRHDPFRIATSVQETSEGYVLNGRKTLVLDGAAADYLIVAARGAGGVADRDGISLFLIAADLPGVQRNRLDLIDSRPAAEIVLTGVVAGKDAMLGRLGDAAGLLDTILDVARIALACEMLGAMQECFDRSVAYLKERVQFGVPIGSFQALKHRAAMLFCEVELSRSCVLSALDALDDPALAGQVARRASLAKAKVGQAFHDVACEAVQFHGGYGMTDECEIGFFLKRAAVTAQLLGDSAFHRKRFASFQACASLSALNGEHVP